MYTVYYLICIYNIYNNNNKINKIVLINPQTRQTDKQTNTIEPFKSIFQIKMIHTLYCPWTKSVIECQTIYYEYCLLHRPFRFLPFRLLGGTFVHSLLWLKLKVIFLFHAAQYGSIHEHNLEPKDNFNNSSQNSAKRCQWFDTSWKKSFHTLFSRSE